MIEISRKDFEQYVDQALEQIPDFFLPYLDNLSIEVADQPGPEDFEDTEGENPEEMLGLYIGCPLTEKGIEDTFTLPDRIRLFRNNILAVCDSREEVIEEIRLTVLHEIGHHFGLDEDHLEELGYD